MEKTCKDCIHYEICGMYDGPYISTHINEGLCEHFKDKSLVIELPFRVGDKIYYISIKRYVPSIYEIVEAEVLDYNIDRYGLRTVTIRRLDSIYSSFAINADKVYSTKSKAETKLKELNENE